MLSRGREGALVGIWQSLALAAVGGFIGIVASWLSASTQIRAADRARSAQYDREDRYRLHGERVEAYSKFYLAAGHVRATLRSTEADQSVKLAARSALWERYTTMVLLAEANVLDIASEVLAYTDRVVQQGEAFEAAAYRGLIHRFQRAARADVIGLADLPAAPIETDLGSQHAGRPSEPSGVKE